MPFIKVSINVLYAEILRNTEGVAGVIGSIRFGIPSVDKAIMECYIFTLFFNMVVERRQ